MSIEREDLPSDTGNPPDPEDHDKLDTDIPRPSSEGGLKSILAWTSIIQVLADVEPLTAAGVGGLLLIIVLSIFGRLGSLIIGVLAGLLLHASFEKRRDSATTYKELFPFAPGPEPIRYWEVWPVLYFEVNTRNHFPTSSLLK